MCVCVYIHRERESFQFKFGRDVPVPYSSFLELNCSSCSSPSDVCCLRYSLSTLSPGAIFLMYSLILPVSSWIVALTLTNTQRPSFYFVYSLREQDLGWNPWWKLFLSLSQSLLSPPLAGPWRYLALADFLLSCSSFPFPFGRLTLSFLTTLPVLVTTQPHLSRPNDILMPLL